MILLRHGQSLFNQHFSAFRVDPGIEDPELTDLGHRQAEAAAKALLAERPTRVIVSPYTRALQTAAPLIAAAAPDARPKVEVTDLIRERYFFACDIGSPPTALAERFPHHEFGHLAPRWWPDQAETADQVIARAASFRAAMAVSADWRSTVVVSHWAFILALTGESVMNGAWIRYDPTAAAPENLVWKP